MEELQIEFKELRRQYFQDFEEDLNKFTKKHSENKLFEYVVNTLNTSFRDVEETSKRQVLLFLEKEKM